MKKDIQLRETLETKSLLLRAFTKEDVEAVHSWASNPENCRYMAWGPNTREMTVEFVTKMTTPGKDFAVVWKTTGEVIGSCGIYPDEEYDTAIEIGWILHKNHWQKGYGSELAGELIRYGFEDLKLRRILSNCAAANYGSYRIMERNGMRREAYQKKAFWARVDQEWVDKVDYAILAEEWFAKKGEN